MSSLEESFFRTGIVIKAHTLPRLMRNNMPNLLPINRKAIHLLSFLSIIALLTGPSIWIVTRVAASQDKFPMIAVTLNESQVDFKTWTTQNVTSVHLTLVFPDSSYKVSDWGQLVRSGDTFSVDIK